MRFETVYNIGEVFGDDAGRNFLTKKERDKLIRSPERYKVLYFLRKSRYHTFHDFPALGGSETVLTGSSVEGPFTSPPSEIAKERLDYCEGVIEIFVPADKVPRSFEKVELINYGIRTGSVFGPDLMNKINENKVKEIGETSLKRLPEISKNLEKVDSPGGPIYRSLVDGHIIELDYSEKGFYYPSVNLRAFGKEDGIQKTIEELGLYGLMSVFKDSFYIEMGLKNCSQNGLAYDLSIEDIDDIGKVSELENIIL